MSHRATRCFAGIRIDWDIGDLPLDPFEPVLPLELIEARDADSSTARAPADLSIRAERIADVAENPAVRGAITTVFHGKTQCFLEGKDLILWDGASMLRISHDGKSIDARIHASSLLRVFHFSSVTVMMALLLALRHHGLFHLHAAALRWPDGETWVIPGESSSGKSTLALAAFGSGASYLSDDALLLRAAKSSELDVELVGWARMMRMTSKTAHAFPALQPLLMPCPEGSARDFEIDPRIAFPGRGLRTIQTPLTLLYPRIASTPDSKITPLRSATAFGRTLHACAWVASEHLPKRAEQLALLSKLIDRSRTHELSIGTHVLTDPRAAIEQARTLLRG